MYVFLVWVVTHKHGQWNIGVAMRAGNDCGGQLQADRDV